jgi:crotonobetainyl-CoA:carnitine CoA-transferase CaiB-like acyl-CoA transferase
VALCDVATELTGRAVIAASVTGIEPARDGNHSASVAPQGIYRCADGAWIAVTVASDEQWAAVAGLEAAGWAREERFATAEGRLACQPDLDERMAQLCARSAAHALEATLRQAGVAAAVLGVGLDLTEHPQLVTRGRVFEVTHPVFGRARYIGSPARYAAVPTASMPASAPVFGGHNREILTELGYSPADIDRLAEGKIIGNSPFGMPFK